LRSCHRFPGRSSAIAARRLEVVAVLALLGRLTVVLTLVADATP
jgi:hypothetical protein